jgi:type I restriction enzyme S subunit
MKSDVVSDSLDHISQEAIDGSATTLIPKGSVLMVVRSGILARTVPIAVTGRDLTINQDLKALCPGSAIDPHFLYHLLDSKMNELLSMVSRGATVHRLKTEQIRALEFISPPLPEQQRIVRVLDEAFAGLATAQANAAQNLQNARAIFESQLQAVFTQRGEGWLEMAFEDCIEDVRYTTRVQRKDSGVFFPKNMVYGVVEDTGSTLPRKKRWPVQTKSAT